MVGLVKLEEGEYLCWKCKGNRLVARPDGSESHVISLCPICNGTGKLDWVENVVGKGPISGKEKNGKLFEILMKHAQAQNKAIKVARQNDPETRREYRGNDLRPMPRLWEGPGF